MRWMAKDAVGKNRRALDAGCAPALKTTEREDEVPSSPSDGTPQSARRFLEAAQLGVY
jgi:hypothetical protein